MTDTAKPSVLVERRGRLGHLTLNRPHAINALDSDMVALITVALNDWRSDDEIATVLLTGAGERGLCAGGDIVSIYADANNGGTASEAFWRDEYVLDAMIARYPKPFVAIMSGLVLGGGIGVSAHARHRIVTETSKLGMPETGIGFVPDVGGTWLLSRSPGELGTHAALTASFLDAADAILLGLADHFVPGDRLEELVTVLEAEDAAGAIERFAASAPDSALAAEQHWIDGAYAGDDVAVILDRIAAVDTGASRAAAATIARKSPTALKATLAALRRSRALPDLESDLEQIYRVALRMLREPDLAEGIRAQVIDKDRDPHWSPARLADVSDDHIDSFFEALGARELVLERPAPTWNADKGES